MSDPIRSALSPKEWAEVAAAERGDFNRAPMIYLRAIEHRGTGPHQLDRPHALAALALHDQPFGFTWEDVDLLLRAAGAVEQESADCPVFAPSEVPASFRELADRIAALLPPRGT